MSRMAKRSNIIFSDTASQHSQTPITSSVQSDTLPISISVSSEKFRCTQGKEIEVPPKKLRKVDKQPSNLRNSSRIYYPFQSLSKTIKATKSHNKVKGENKAGEQEIRETLRKGTISLKKKSEYRFLNTHF